MTVKEKAIDLIRALPDDCTLEDIQYHLYVCEKVDRGLQDMDAGRVISQDEAEKQFDQWLK
jgi:predicted transcriptional regulator